MKFDFQWAFGWLYNNTSLQVQPRCNSWMFMMETSTWFTSVALRVSSVLQSSRVSMFTINVAFLHWFHHLSHPLCSLGSHELILDEDFHTYFVHWFDEWDYRQSNSIVVVIGLLWLLVQYVFIFVIPNCRINSMVGQSYLYEFWAVVNQPKQWWMPLSMSIAHPIGIKILASSCILKNLYLFSTNSQANKIKWKMEHDHVVPIIGCVFIIAGIVTLVAVTSYNSNFHHG